MIPYPSELVLEQSGEYVVKIKLTTGDLHEAREKYAQILHDINNIAKSRVAFSETLRTFLGF